MILRDFECTQCNHIFEEMEPSAAEMKLAEKQSWGWKATACPQCEGYEIKPVFHKKSALPCENMVPTYPGCKKQKAGYTHTRHADHAATRIQSGPGGCQGPPV